MKRSHTLLALALAASPLALATGCASSDEAAGKHVVISNLEVPAYDFNVSAQQLVQKVQELVQAPPISLPIEKVEKGTIVTGWKDYPGDFHIARRWQDQTRYMIKIYPGFDNPTATSHLEVVQETRTRASDQQKNWYTWAEVQKPERAAQLAQTLRDKINAGTAPTTAR